MRWRRRARSPRGPPPRWSSSRATLGVTPGATVGVTPGATVGVTLKVTPGVTLGATPGVTVGAEARPPGRRAPRQSRQQPPARVVAARCGPPREARMHIAGPPTRRPQSRSTTPHCHGRTQLSRRRGPCGKLFIFNRRYFKKVGCGKVGGRAPARRKRAALPGGRLEPRARTALGTPAVHPRAAASGERGHRAHAAQGQL